jgi:hypothetical protein
MKAEGRLAAQELGRKLQRIAPQGVTEGSLFVPITLSEIML